MPETLTIARTAVLRKSQDYVFLRSEGLKHLEELGHELWTDFNIHDPGIAMMELFCYAITELGYRTGYDIRDILTEDANGVLESRGDFHPAHEILTCNPVSFDDLRKLLIDITGVRNAWVSVNQNFKYHLDRIEQTLGLTGTPAGEQKLNGLYDVHVEFEEFVVDMDRKARFGILNRLAEGAFIPPDAKGIAFNVEHEITINSVAIYGATAGAIEIRLVDREGEILAAKTTNTSPGAKKVVTLRFRVPPGEGYRLQAHGGVKLYRQDRSEARFPYGVDHLVHLAGGHSGAQSNDFYYFFYDWRISYALPPLAGLRPLTRTAVAGPAKSAAGDFRRPRGRGVEFVAARDADLAGFAVYSEDAGDITVRLRSPSTGSEIAHTAQIKEGFNRVETPGFELAGGASYRLEVRSRAPRLLECKGLSYPYEVDNVVTVGNPYRNPDSWSGSGQPPTDVSVLFDLTLEYPSQPHPIHITEDDVLTAVRNRLHTRRNLCEDFVEVCDLEIEDIALCADIGVSPSADVDEVLAEVFYRLRLHVSPAVRFYSFKEMRARGKGAEEIFEGPLLDHGFIDDDEFKEITRRCEIRTSDVVQIVMDVPGVETIKSISLLRFSEGEETLHEDWQLPLRPAEGRAPRFADDQRSKIVFYQNDLPVFADRDKVTRLLKDKKARELQTKLKGYRTEVPVPVGVDRDVERYYPLQNELPVNFKVGRIRVAKTETALRKAQSRQLKAYLLLFEQILANHLSQLANLPRLFSWQPEDDATYFTQPVFGFAEHEAIYNIDGIIATIEGAGNAVPQSPVLNAELARALELIIESTPIQLDRRNRFLDHLLARFSEDVTAYAALMQRMSGRKGLEELIDHKRRFLADYPGLSANRGGAYDYRFPGEPDNVAGFKHRICRLIGLEDTTHRRLADAGISIEKVGDEWRFAVRRDPEAAGGPRIFTSMTCEEREVIEALLDAVIEYGSEKGNYVGRELRWTCPGRPVEVLGNVAANSTVETVRGRFASLRRREGFHLVEHVLLRLRTANQPLANPVPPNPFMAVQLNPEGECECVDVTDPYSFRLSVILPSWPDRFRDTRFRRYVEETLRSEAPAHIFLKICWINHEQMRELEACLIDWRGQLGMLAPSLGVCRKDSAQLPLTGEPTMPQTRNEHHPYQRSLGDLIDKLENMINVYPLATLYNCDEDAERTHDDKQPITLNNTSLGTS